MTLQNSFKMAAVMAALAFTLSGCATLTSAYDSVSNEVSSWFSSSDSKDSGKK